MEHSMTQGGSALALGAIGTFLTERLQADVGHPLSGT
jgi:hypothetical protein